MSNLLKTYLQEIGEFGVLTAEEEIDLAHRIQIGKGAKQDLEENGDRYSPEEKSNLYDLIRSGEDAREDMINHNLKLVVSIAKNYHNSHLDLNDLIQEGNMGLMIAVDKFDPSFNCRFSTCATPWIKQAITKSIIDKGKNIRIPAHIFQLLSKYRQLLEELSREGIETPEPELIAERLGIDMDKVKELESWRQDTVSLSNPLGDDSEDTLEDLQADFNQENPMQYTQRKELEDKIQNKLNELKPRTRAIMKMRYGLGGPEDPADWRQPHTLEEIGLALGITRERVRQIEKQTLAELKMTWDK